MIRIETQKQLDELIEDTPEGMLECFVMLNSGLRSSKCISLEGNNIYWILNEIDDSEEYVEHDKLNKTIIWEAMEKGALYKY